MYVLDFCKNHLLIRSRSGLWIIFPSYNIYTLGAEILDSLDQTNSRGKPGRPKSS